MTKKTCEQQFTSIKTQAVLSLDHKIFDSVVYKSHQNTHFTRSSNVMSPLCLMHLSFQTLTD